MASAKPKKKPATKTTKKKELPKKSMLSIIPKKGTPVILPPATPPADDHSPVAKFTRKEWKALHLFERQGITKEELRHIFGFGTLTDYPLEVIDVGSELAHLYKNGNIMLVPKFVQPTGMKTFAERTTILIKQGSGMKITIEGEAIKFSEVEDRDDPSLDDRPGDEDRDEDLKEQKRSDVDSNIDETEE